MDLVLNQNQAHVPFFASKTDNKDVHIDFDGGNLSNDAGGLILREIDQEIGLVEDIAANLTDSRDPAKIDHTLEDLLIQRISQIACGYEDANDSDTLRHDPIIKMLAGRAPETGLPLASLPTFSRFENSVDKELMINKSGCSSTALSTPTLICRTLLSQTQTRLMIRFTVPNKRPCSTAIITSIASCRSIFMKESAAT